ncbi:hypothetical protein D8S82_00740 [Mycobacterium hodleri]|uniref:Uncharacterized protein n=1 Tax=Mycolicibacterium hodleri TaxID=49897 RepID=A0A544W8J3_9MYCO|nr:hypothetical protein [Mycolicibacterium hodleri]TQR88567.1 hypothetical protein D8S82_00740 [Mycolicibacterium hodleri]
MSATGATVLSDSGHELQADASQHAEHGEGGRVGVGSVGAVGDAVADVAASTVRNHVSRST